MKQMPGRTPMVIRNLSDAIAAIPYLLGFHPADSLVVIAYDGPHNTCAIRVDLPSDDPVQAADRVSGVLAGNGFRRALLVGYGPEERVVAAAATTAERLRARGLVLTDAARVTDGRWWSLTCADIDCCPPEGTLCDISASPVAAQATYCGHVALADRTELEHAVAPVTGPARASMNTATRQATKRRDDRLKRLSPREFRREMTREGLTLLTALRNTATPRETPQPTPHSNAQINQNGSAFRQPDDNEVAWLGVLLTNLRVRDEAWIRINEDEPAGDIEFWRDILSRVDEQFADAPACLLAYAAYMAGDGGMANVALERASPDYSLAAILRDVIAAGIPPSEVRIRMTPEELAAAYAELDDE